MVSGRPRRVAVRRQLPRHACPTWWLPTGWPIPGHCGTSTGRSGFTWHSSRLEDSASASCLHALSRPEIEHLRGLAPGTPIGFVPNGVDLARFDRPSRRGRNWRRNTRHCGANSSSSSSDGSMPRKDSTCSPHALRRIAGERPDLHLLLAGTDEGALAPFRTAMEALGLAERYTYLGHVAGEEARRTWAAADAFILPSYSEGFSMAILEAMACRIPCLITTACHFPEAATAGGGDRRRSDPRRRHPGSARAARTSGRGNARRWARRPTTRRTRLHLGPSGGASDRDLRLARRRRTAAG